MDNKDTEITALLAQRDELAAALNESLQALKLWQNWDSYRSEWVRLTGIHTREAEQRLMSVWTAMIHHADAARDATNAILSDR